MRNEGKFLTGLLIGAGVMYLLDPERGARRRALVRDKVNQLGHRVGDDLGARSRDLRDRAAGKVREVRSRFEHEDVDDERLEARVRSAIGRATSHPSAIDVVAFAGRVTLQGTVLQDEVEGVLAAARGVRGVDEVDNQLQMHSVAGREPSLQGERSS